MPFPFRIDRDSALPLYHQIAGQIRQQIRDGLLPVGAKLPPIRQMAEQLGVTRLTAQTAYDELHAQGWIETVVGRGTFVAGTARPEALIDAVGHSMLPGDVLDDQHRIDQIAIVRSFAYAEPDPNLFPSSELWGEIGRLREESATLLRYSWPQGDPVLRTVLVNLLNERGVEAMPDDILVTAGVTQGVSLVAQALTRPGDAVVVERPTHLGLLNTLRTYGVQPIPVPLDDKGPRLDELERIIVQYRPRFFHTVPNFHHPTGILTSSERRRDLLALARQYGLMLVEDDASGPLAYDGEPDPALKSLDEMEQVVYISSMSKVMMPGLRVGCVVAPRPLHGQLVGLRRASDFCGPPFVQRAVANFIRGGALKRHLRKVVPIYRERRDRLMRDLHWYMPAGVTWARPKGGFTCWLTLPPGVAAADVNREALRCGFAFTPGDAFLTEPETSDHLRICFVSQPIEVIDEAMAVLGRIIKGQSGASFPAAPHPDMPHG